MRNPGKIFENDFKKSIPKDVWNKKWPDSAIGFNTEDSRQRFAAKSPFDYILCKKGQMYDFELKSTKDKRLSFRGRDPAIKMRQIEELINAKRVGKAKTGLIINFRLFEETYVIDPEIFLAFAENTAKSSINIEDVRLIGIKIPQTRLRRHYRYDINTLLKAL